jgi:hypothetical protein
VLSAQQVLATNKARITRFSPFFIIKKLIFWFISLLIISFILFILTLPFLLILRFTGSRRLDRIHLRGFTRRSSRRSSILYTGSSRFGIGMIDLFCLSLYMKSVNHTINNMRCYRKHWGWICRRARSVKDQVIQCAHLRINEIQVLGRTDFLFFNDDTSHGNITSYGTNE